MGITCSISINGVFVMLHVDHQNKAGKYTNNPGHPQENKGSRQGFVSSVRARAVSECTNDIIVENSGANCGTQ